MYVALDLMVRYEENWYDVPLFLKSVMVFYGKAVVIFTFLLNQNV